MSNLTISCTEENGALLLSLEGQVDEDSSFSGGDISGASKIVIDLEKVTAINSCGIREWIKWIGDAAGAEKIVYKNCPKVIVDQINMVAGFLPANGSVESFYVPYYGEESGEEKMVLFVQGKDFNGSEINAPTDIKDSDGEEMEMDIIEAKYFKFLNN